ncbi:MAG: DUF1800 domain-containing protein, partial [Candidatus Eisenbacteria bacterium]|nr:DUF1800 domain-containing protein [Candidatus Eisenbacteria bacterium]
RLGPHVSLGYQTEAVVGDGPGIFTPFGSWKPYRGSFNHDEASHLLGRTVIGARFAEIDQAVQRGLPAEVDHLLEPRVLPDAPGPWATMPHPDTEGWDQARIDSLYSVYWKLRDPLRLWWVDHMLQADDNLTEEMTLFWHDHFATSIDKVTLPQSMYVQNQLLREYALGNFKELIYRVAVDPAMLIWLDGQENRRGRINENFGRELLELFTMGIGNYTQEDVREASRALTGWVTVDGITSEFVPERWDSGTKTFLGKTGPFDTQDIIDIIFEQPATAEFLCRKLYVWFVDEYPSDALVQSLAQTLRENDYEVRPVLSRIFQSQQFFSRNLRGSLIADAMDRIVGPLRALEVQDIDLSSPENTQAQWVLFSMSELGMLLMEPPNVGGWPGYRAWLDSNTLPWRKVLDTALIDGEIDGWDLKMQSDVYAWAAQLRNPNDAYLLIDDLGIQLFGMTPTPAIHDVLLSELLQGSEPWEWDLYGPESEDRLRGVLRLALRLPDYQVK